MRKGIKMYKNIINKNNINIKNNRYHTMEPVDNIKYQVVDEESKLYESVPASITTKTNTLDEFKDQVMNFIQVNNPKLYILTPCFGGTCYINYLTCLINTITLFRQFNFPIQIEFCKNDSLISRARNNLIARALNDPSMTHVMFIDNDITWDPIDIMKLILSEKELIGGIYPLKHYDWSKLVNDSTNPYNTNIVQQWLKKKNESQLKDIISDEKMIQYNMLKYNVNYLDTLLEINKNIAKVKHLATGFMLIRREVLTQMIEKFPSTKYVDDVNFLRPEENEFAYALFDCGVEDGHYFSEDWMFCSRWTKMGKDIFIDVSIQLTHTGVEDYCGSYISSII
jgi:hypothetical protein